MISFGDLINLSEIEIVALTIYGEARGESIEGQVAVANVIRNRMRKNGQLASQVCLAPKQFSCWNPNDANYVVLMELAERLIVGEIISQLRQCQWVAEGVLKAAVTDNTQGAVNYLTRTLFNSDKKPSWASKMVNVKMIGNHMFGTAV